MAKKLFITGTGTDTGKTYVSALILKKLAGSGASVAYFKAAVSGNERGEDGRLIPGDPLYVKEIAGISQPLEEMCPYVYQQPLSPHLAARLEGEPVSMERVLKSFRRVCAQYDYITVEGSGGIICPLRFDENKFWLADLIKELGLSCLLVADAGLGVINSVGLTACYMRRENLPLKGIILNRFKPGNAMHEDNLKMCEYVSGAKVVACLEDDATQLDIPVEELASLFE